MIEPVDIQPALIDQVLDRLVAAIADGTLAPGARITQETVAARLGVSRQPVSHALQVLKRRGLLVENGKRGLLVAPLDPDRLRDLYQVRAALDGLAARLAAERARARLLPPKLCAIAERQVANGTELAIHGSVGELIAADVAFHSTLYALSGNSAIAETVAEEWPHFMRSMGAVLADYDVRLRSRVWAEHAEILTAILAGRAGPAQRLSQQHARRAGEYMTRRVQHLASVA